MLPTWRGLTNSQGKSACSIKLRNVWENTYGYVLKAFFSHRFSQQHSKTAVISAWNTLRSFPIGIKKSVTGLILCILAPYNVCTKYLPTSDGNEWWNTAQLQTVGQLLQTDQTSVPHPQL